MKFTPQEIPDVILVEPVVHRDDRGFFLECYHVDRFREGGINVKFVQDNHSLSSRGTFRGLHAQTARPQGKLIRVLSGEIYDVAVDVRRGSPTFGQFAGATLSSENFHQLFVPVGFIHGFMVTSETAEVEYKCSDIYDPSGELGVRWNDPAIGIPWPIEHPLLSEKDATAPLLSEVDPELLPVYRA